MELGTAIQSLQAQLMVSGRLVLTYETSGLLPSSMAQTTTGEVGQLSFAVTLKDSVLGSCWSKGTTHTSGREQQGNS